MRGASSEAIERLGAMQGAEAVISLQLAVWHELTDIDRVIAWGRIIDVPRFDAAGNVEREIDDPKMAAATLYECTVLRPRQMIEAQRRLADDVRLAAEREGASAAISDIDAAEKQLSSAQAVLDDAES